MTIVVLLGFVSAWLLVVSLQQLSILRELSRQRQRWTELTKVTAAEADLVATIAGNAKNGAGFMREHRERIERLERWARIDPRRTEGPN